MFAPLKPKPRFGLARPYGVRLGRMLLYYLPLTLEEPEQNLNVGLEKYFSSQHELDVFQRDRTFSQNDRFRAQAIHHCRRDTSRRLTSIQDEGDASV